MLCWIYHLCAWCAKNNRLRLSQYQHLLRSRKVTPEPLISR
ncbi:hypothetical protein FGE25_20875 [Kosakonia sacchari]|nr:hypothetical protein FGE25_20875 [Kosakonia sacchari]